MPIYIFKHPEKEEHEEVVQKMADEHVYFDNDGLQWQRVFTAPATISLGLISDTDSSSQFVDKTKGWTAGEMWDYSKELSERRKDKRGDDHVERAHSKKRSSDRKRKQGLQGKIKEHKHRQSSKNK